MENTGFKTIGYKKGGIGIVYIFALTLGVLLITGGCFLVIAEKEVAGSGMFFLGGILVIGVSIVEMIEYYSTKVDVISTDGERMKINDNLFLIKDIVDVSYRRASYKGGQYRYGKIIVKTKDTSYTAQFVAECESVSKEITRLMYEKKNQLNNF